MWNLSLRNNFKILPGPYATMLRHDLDVVGHDQTDYATVVIIRMSLYANI